MDLRLHFDPPLEQNSHDILIDVESNIHQGNHASLHLAQVFSVGTPSK